MKRKENAVSGGKKAGKHANTKGIATRHGLNPVRPAVHKATTALEMEKKRMKIVREHVKEMGVLRLRKKKIRVWRYMKERGGKPR